ncbi:helix-turn-helix domain-containing protein [Patescibacteria group bacterium]|nr:helix-turn-helix domain-containing protein [Patescibacteria group bacterium]
MKDFSTRTIQRSKTLGERLKKVREESGFSLADVEKATQIRRSYIEAIENGDYKALPGAVYIESFLKKYADFLQVSVDYVLDLYRQHESRVVPQQQHIGLSMHEKKLPKSIITPKIVRGILIGLVIAAALTYFGIVVVKIFSPPSLTVDYPSDSITVRDTMIDIRGSTEPEIQLKINGREIFLDAKGNFLETVILSEGLNTIIITAEKRQSKVTEIRRTVLYEPSIE